MEEDVFGGSKTRKRQFTFKVLRVFKKIFAEVERDSIYEDASAVIGDFNNDKVNDFLFVLQEVVKMHLIYKTASTFP
jgi:hypothetical protein